MLIYSEDGIVQKILKKKFKNLGIDNYHDIDTHTKKKGINDKIDFEMDGFSRDKMGELKINNKKDNDMLTVEDDEININTDIGK